MTDRRVSDAAVREASATHDSTDADAPRRAAAQMRRLLAAGAVRPPVAVAVFAATLAEVNGQATDPAAIAACAALADALAAEITAAGDDQAALARLFDGFSDHV